MLPHMPQKHKKYWPENYRVRYHLSDLHVDGKIILKWILGTLGVRGLSGFI